MILNFSSGVNLLIGDNGVGKTTVLEALALSVQAYFSRMNDITKKGITQKGTVLPVALLVMLPSIGCTIHQQRSKARLSLVELSIRVKYPERMKRMLLVQSMQARNIATAGRELLNSQTEILPVICYFSTSRVVDTQKASTSSVGKNKLNDRRCGYMDCLNATLDRKALTDWAFKMAMAEYKKGMPIAEYEAVQKSGRHLYAEDE